MADDWYRNHNWNSEIESQFFEKLSRSRSQRDQYLVIQALSLTSTFPEISIQLVSEFFKTRKDDFEDVRALLAKTNALLNLNRIDEAIEAYRAVLKREEEFPKHQTTAYIDYPYFVATHNIESEYSNALSVLEKHFDRLMFPADCYKWYAAKALIENNSDYASKALDAAEVKRSGFRFHQSIGLVGKEHADTIERLCNIST